MRRRMMPRRVLGACAAATLLATGTAASSSPPASGQAVKVDRQHYVVDTPFDPYNSDATAVHVGVQAGQESARSFVHVELPTGAQVTDVVLTFHPTPGQPDPSANPLDDVNASSAAIAACPLVTALPAAFDPASPPGYDCKGGSATGRAASDGTWRFDLVPLLAYWHEHGNTGAALVPVVSTATDSWAIAFEVKQTSARALLAVTTRSGPARTGVPPANPTTGSAASTLDRSLPNTVAAAPSSASAPVPLAQPATTREGTGAAQAPTLATPAAAPARATVASASRGLHGPAVWRIAIVVVALIAGAAEVLRRRGALPNPRSLSPNWRNRLIVANAVILTAGVLSIGQVHYEQGKRRQHQQPVNALRVNPLTTPGAAGAPGIGPDGKPRRGTAESSRGPAAHGQNPGTGTGMLQSSLGPRTGPVASYPHFGLVTQGITKTSVLIGASYNVSGCGDAGTYGAAVGQAAIGDPKKAYDAFVRYVNDTGGIGHRILKLAVADDGAGGCPEKEQSAAVKLVDDDKAFLVIPGINPVGDFALAHKIPVLGGRDDPASIAKTAPNGLGLLAPLDPTFEAWAGFGAYDLGSTSEPACLVHPDDSDWNSYEKLLVAKATKYGFKFKDIIRYSSDASQAVSQANAATNRMRNDGCQEVWFMDWNGIAAVFLTSAATQNGFFPRVWTFTSYTALMDYELSGRLMDKTQWKNAIGLSARVPAGQHPAEGQCTDIYQHYYGKDGNESSASVTLACAQILTAAEFMRRGVQHYGVLNSDTLLLGAGAVHNDYYFDAHVPLDYEIPGPAGPFRTKGQRHFTIVKWDSTSQTYMFPNYPNYWVSFGPNLSGAVDLRSYWRNWKRLPMPS